MPGQRIVIIGGGFGGAFTAKYLRRFAAGGSKIELINATNYFVFQPLLPEVASGTISAPDAVTPLRICCPASGCAWPKSRMWIWMRARFVSCRERGVFRRHSIRLTW